MLKNLLKKYKLNRSGAALVMVIVVISFVSITATILLYVSAMNFYMKTTDMQTKKSFYSGETAMEEIKAHLMVQATKAFEKAYASVIVDYSTMDAENMQKALNEAFVKEFDSQWKKTTNPSTPSLLPSEDTLQTYLQGVVNTRYAAGLTVKANESTGLTASKDITEGTYRIEKVCLKYTDSNNYTTIISTDFVIQAPQITFDRSYTGTEDIKLLDCVIYSNWLKE